MNLCFPSVAVYEFAWLTCGVIASVQPSTGKTWPHFVGFFTSLFCRFVDFFPRAWTNLATCKKEKLIHDRDISEVKPTYPAQAGSAIAFVLLEADQNKLMTNEVPASKVVVQSNSFELGLLSPPRLFQVRFHGWHEPKHGLCSKFVVTCKL